MVSVSANNLIWWLTFANCWLKIELKMRYLYLQWITYLSNIQMLWFFPTKYTNFGFRRKSQTSTENRLFKMHTHRQCRPYHKAFNITRRKKSFLIQWQWNVWWHELNCHRKLRRKILRGWVYNMLFQTGLNFAHLKSVLLNQFNAKEGQT